MKLRIRWHPAIVLVLCGLPLFGYTAWRVYTGGKVRELTLEVDADDQVIVKVRRRWATLEASGFNTDDVDRLYDAIQSFVREADVDDYGLPKLPVRVALTDGTSADVLWRLLVLLMRNWLCEVTLESPERAVSFELPRGESNMGIPPPGKPRSLDVASVSLPSGGRGAWVVQELAFDQAYVARLDIERLPEDLQRGWSEKEKELAVPVDLDRRSVDLSFRESWKKVVQRADRARARTVGAVEEIDFSGFDAVGILWGESALARDLVRAVAAIKANDPAPNFILVVPERE